MTFIKSVETAREVATLKRDLANAYREVCHFSQQGTDEHLEVANRAFLEEFLSEIALKYEQDGDQKQANNLRKIRDLPSDDYQSQEKQSRAIEDFFYNETVFFTDLSEKYTKILTDHYGRGINGKQLEFHFTYR